MRPLLLICFSAGLLAAVAGTVSAAVPSWSENWEGYGMGSATPYRNWELQQGDSGMIVSPGRDGNGQCYQIQAGSVSRIRNYVNLDNNNHVVLQGWFRDSGGPNYSMLGLANETTTDDNSMIRIGANGEANYVIQYYDGIAGGGDPNASLFTIDTGVAVEEGWHFFRLDIVYVPNPYGLWSVRWNVTNYNGSVQKTGEFGWWFANQDSDYVTLGSTIAVTGDVCWDDIWVGSPVVATNNRNLQHQVTVNARKNFNYRIWGWVTPLEADLIEINDGSGPMRVRIEKHGLSAGQFIATSGYYDAGMAPPQLNSDLSLVEVLN